jgi:hypothetical protein
MLLPSSPANGSLVGIGRLVYDYHQRWRITLLPRSSNLRDASAVSEPDVRPPTRVEGGVSVPVEITNTSGGLLTLELKSGVWVYLAPSETSRPLQDLEITANRSVQRLLDRDLIAVEEVKAEPAPGGARPAGRRKRTSKA